MNEEDRAMVESVVGTEACEFLVSSASENTLSDLVPMSGDLSVQKGLCQIVEGSNWNYAVFFVAGCELEIWWFCLNMGNEYCRDLRRGGAGDLDRCGDGSLKGVERKEGVEKLVLYKLHASFGGSDEDNFAASLDGVSAVEMFYLTSMYFTFSVRFI